MPRKFIESFGNALRGLIFAFRTQRNLSIHILVAISVVYIALLLQISLLEMIVLILVISLVIVLELINTAIEEVVNMLTLIRKMRAMVAKDVAAGAVLVASISSVIIGLMIFLPKIIDIYLRILK